MDANTKSYKKMFLFKHKVQVLQCACCEYTDYPQVLDGPGDPQSRKLALAGVS